MATVVEIVQKFTAEYNEAKIFFAGSTTSRTTLYRRILRTYYADFIKEFKITAVLEERNILLEQRFDPQSETKYLAFL